MKFSIKDLLSKCNQIRSFLRIWPHLLKKTLMENFIFCAVFLIPSVILSFDLKNISGYCEYLTTDVVWDMV